MTSERECCPESQLLRIDRHTVKVPYGGKTVFVFLKDKGNESPSAKSSQCHHLLNRLHGRTLLSEFVNRRKYRFKRSATHEQQLPRTKTKPVKTINLNGLYIFDMVPRAGLEPAQESPLPPQDSVSTNSTTSARRDVYAKRNALASLFCKKKLFSCRYFPFQK